MTKSDIIGTMAKSRLVEKAIEYMAHQPLDYDLQDLSQMIYEALLEQPEERIQELWASSEMLFFVKGIIKRQLFSKTSPYYINIQKFNAITGDVSRFYNMDERVVHNESRDDGREFTCE